MAKRVTAKMANGQLDDSGTIRFGLNIDAATSFGR
jgi:hypothetical protein